MPSASPLRIAMISLHTNPYGDPGTGDVGGMNIVIQHISAELAALGHHVDVITRRSAPEQPDAIELAPRLTLRTITAGPEHPLPKAEHEACIEPFADQLRTFGDYDVIHAHHWYSGLAALPVARECGAVLLQSFHSIAADADTALDNGEPPETPRRLTAERTLAREADAVITVSHAEQRTVVERLGGDASRVHVVSPGVDARCFHPGTAAVPRYVAAAARIEPLKGLDLAVAAIASTDAALRPDLRIAGGPSSQDGGCLRALRQQAADAGIGERVRFDGAMSHAELAELMRAASVFLVPSHSETYGLVALEAAASGVPVIAMATGGLPEAVHDGETGLLLHDRSPETWARALTRLLDDAELRERMGRAGRALALQRSWVKSAQRLVQIYGRQRRLMRTAVQPA
ncbi:glycosyltransferase [Pseudoclavibacter sp. 13-3]|uniref:glycosyltransferase n=1 Tax=Pseudoclavibacter sp. 13-3 TaxID=2901228 RepID=UPI001E3B08CB|nr:glycosyltransferase [Pseudoclavibacter sp. 13-3]MCD7100682.1 glycosyltransferase [Pseudoclavibacter sp. 13-3]